MKKLILPFLMLSFILASCSKSMIDDPGRNSNAGNESAISMVHRVLNFQAHLSGDNEIPPRLTQAQGQAVFQLSKDGQELSYKVIVANLDNISMSHIHVAPSTANGPVVVWLYPSAPPAVLIPGTSNGILNQGVITKSNLAGSLKGKELSDLVDLMVSGMTYVNVHTSQFGGGEIRGQIKSNSNED